MKSLFQDIRFCVRMLIRQPGFTAVAVLALALGIGANTAIFSVVNAVLLRPLPYPASDQIVRVYNNNPSRGWSRSSISFQDFVDWKEQSKAFAYMAAFNPRSTNLSGEQGPERVDYAMVTSDIFSVLGAKPVLGRAFLPEDDVSGSGEVIVISHGFWQRYFGGANDVIGKRLILNGAPNTIVGVMPSYVRFPSADIELWKPIARSPDSTGSRGSHWLSAIARIKPEATIEEAQAEMSVIAERLAKQYPDSNKGWGVELVSLHEQQTGDLRPALLLLWGAVGLVLLIACANVANLLLARAASREKEIAIRSALGAMRGRIIRQLLTESTLLAASGGAVGLLFAVWGIRLLPELSAAGIAEEIQIDGRVMIYSFALSLLTGIIFGLVPAFKTSKSDLNDALKEGGRSHAGSSNNRVRSVLVIAEVALTLVLLVGAGLLMRSFVRLLNVDMGFDTDRLLTLRIAPPQTLPQTDGDMDAFFKRYLDERRQWSAFYSSLRERVEGMPGVESVGAINRLPLAGNWWSMYILPEGGPSWRSGDQPAAYGRVVDTGYLQTMKIPLLKGRMLTDLDDGSAPLAAVINQSMAQAFWPGQDPLGKRLRFGEESVFDWVTVVGIVGDVRYTNVETAPAPTIYVPFAQTMFGFFGDWGMTIVARTESDPSAMTAAIREQIHAMDKSLPLYEVNTMDQLMSESVAEQRFNMLLLAIFGALALVLAMVGIYGVISYSVSQRTREIGVRVALGATRSDIFKLVIGQGMILILIGVGLGLAASLVLTRLLTTLLYEVSPTDTLTFAGISFLLISVALLACYIPARRATRVDPMTALRYE